MGWSIGERITGRDEKRSTKIIATGTGHGIPRRTGMTHVWERGGKRIKSYFDNILILSKSLFKK